MISLTGLPYSHESKTIFFSKNMTHRFGGCLRFAALLKSGSKEKTGCATKEKSLGYKRMRGYCGSLANLADHPHPLEPIWAAATQSFVVAAAILSFSFTSLPRVWCCSVLEYFSDVPRSVHYNDAHRSGREDERIGKSWRKKRSASKWLVRNDVTSWWISASLHAASTVLRAPPLFADAYMWIWVVHKLAFH